MATSYFQCLHGLSSSPADPTSGSHLYPSSLRRKAGLRAPLKGCLRDVNPLRSSPPLPPSPATSSRRRFAIVRGSAPLDLVAPTTDTSTTLKRSDFPADFLFGAGTSAFQVEGGTTAGGRGMASWDCFIREPGRVWTGDLNYPGADFFNRYEDDIQMCKELGFDTFRLSISWPRIYPNGVEPQSSEGIAFYNSVINTIVRAGLKPLVTLFHWEVPQYLENDPNVLGFRTKNIVPYFVQLADTCFRHFGDRVKMWTTINEMSIYSTHGYSTGFFAPGRCTPKFMEGTNDLCVEGDARTEPYEVGHNLLLAHAAVYHIYKNKYQEHQRGEVGFNPSQVGVEPYSDSQEDVAAAERYMEFKTGWQLDPLVFGDYPKSMRDALGDRLPTFTKEESELLKNSFDFMGHNYYTASFIRNQKLPKDPSERWFGNDSGTQTYNTNAEGKLIGEHMGPQNSWIYNCPEYLIKVLDWMRNRYGNIPCYITENGVMDPDANDVNAILNDTQRQTYVIDHLTHLAKGIKEKGHDVRGYYYWSFIDNFEWALGFSMRFGTVFVNFDDKSRTPKASAEWFRSFLTK